MCTDVKGYLYFVRKSIKADNEKVTNFSRADDRLSRCASAILKLNREIQKGIRLEGEYPNYEVWAEIYSREINLITEDFGFTCPDEMMRAMLQVADNKQLYMLFGSIAIQAE